MTRAAHAYMRGNVRDLWMACATSSGGQSQSSSATFESSWWPFHH